MINNDRFEREDVFLKLEFHVVVWVKDLSRPVNESTGPNKRSSGSECNVREPDVRTGQGVQQSVRCKWSRILRNLKRIPSQISFLEHLLRVLSNFGQISLRKSCDNHPRILG